MNPHIRDCNGFTEYDYYFLSQLKNVPTLKSVHFIIKSITSTVAGDSWRYTNGIYPVTIIDIIGQGGEGVVLGGELNGVKVALKFVKIGALKFTEFTKDGLADLDTRLSEMTAMNASAGSCVLEVLGHYR